MPAVPVILPATSRFVAPASVVVPMVTPPAVEMLMRSVEFVPSVSLTPFAELIKVVFAKLPAVVPA